MSCSFHFKLFGVYFYVSRVRLKRRRETERTSVRKQMKRLRWVLYREQDGCCGLCGKQFGMDVMEIHHKEPVSVRPELMLKKSNLVLLCPNCHRGVHRGERKVIDD